MSNDLFHEIARTLICIMVGTALGIHVQQLSSARMVEAGTITLLYHEAAFSDDRGFQVRIETQDGRFRWVTVDADEYNSLRVGQYFEVPESEQ